MKKLFIVLGLAVPLFFVNSWLTESPTHANENDNATPEVKLSEEQKSELDALYQDLFEKRKEIIDKYVEYGVLSKEKADKKREHLDKFYKKLKENNYIPKWEHHKHKHHHEH
ncbi:YckD family protein [Bacillus sp. PS06]|uniref:YckD family protein n=1 Tax=Bacillus sp. PS06 TaxID=2764176 RepID=UPI001786EE49|nr:YckD family protein [Bacillus sp. PS06]MBD8067777.1 YckD family protein [Bacillus sp. PS06]